MQNWTKIAATAVSVFALLLTIPFVLLASL